MLLEIGIALFILLCLRWYWFSRRLSPQLLHNTAVVVTGCDNESGFGWSLVRRLRHQSMQQLSKTGGFLVYAGCYTEEAIERIKNEHDDLVHAFQVDITKQESVDNAVSWLRKHLDTSGRYLLALVNNAGVGTPMVPDEWLTAEDYARALTVNTVGQIRMTHAMLPLLKASTDVGCPGRIVFMSSQLARNAICGLAPYGVSKRALEAYGDSIRVELMPYRIDVSLIQPGTFNTAMTEIELAKRQMYERHSQLPEHIKREYSDAFCVDSSVE